MPLQLYDAGGYTGGLAGSGIIVRIPVAQTPAISGDA